MNAIENATQSPAISDAWVKVRDAIGELGMAYQANIEAQYMPFDDDHLTDDELQSYYDAMRSMICRAWMKSGVDGMLS